VRQISRDTLRQLGDTMVIHIFLSNKEQNKTKTLTDKDVYQRVKDEYGWDQASVVKDQIMNISGTAKNGVDELKEKRGLMTKGIKGLPDVKPQSLLMKGARYFGPLGEGYSAYTTIDNIDKTYNKVQNQQKLVKQCFENEKNKYNGDMKRCITLQKNTIINFEHNLFESVGYGALSSKSRGTK
jgi:hypothetical protein